MLITSTQLEIISMLIALVHLLGFLAAIDALFLTKSSQGAIAWSLWLIVFPYLALPMYWVFGRARFKGYAELFTSFADAHKAELGVLEQHFKKFISESPPLAREEERVFEEIASSQFTNNNSVSLLIDGQETFKAVFQAIAEARTYVLLEYYIIRDDDLGRQLKEALVTQAKRGVAVYLLYDEIGSQALASSYLEELKSCGIQARPFATRQGLGNFFQFNFRNHRKIVVVDGKVAFIGGLNVGDEYMGKSSHFGEWRDTCVRIQGPVVIPIQGTFFADWYWATQQALELHWEPEKRTDNYSALALPSGPADDRERCLLFFLQAINSAKERLWIASPYFVPDDSVLKALQLAALRGVDVRIMLPNKLDYYLVWLASFYYIPEVTRYGVKVYRYSKGFLHQKVILIDSYLAAVGTANLDNRSFRLNFEISLLVADSGFNAKVAEMLERDFQNSSEERILDFSDLPIRIRLGAKFARLFSPVL